jgi:predicted phage terminase large subunit-like protein
MRQVASRYVTDRSKSSSLSAAQELHRLLQNDASRQIQLQQVPSNMDKTAQLLSAQHLFQEGIIYAPNKERADLVIEVIENVVAFSRAAHDDLSGATSMVMRYLRDYGMALQSHEHSESDMRLSSHRPQRLKALYDVEDLRSMGRW